TTKVIARSLSPNSKMASGNQAIDGIVCRPVINDPTADRTIRDDDTAPPTTTPMASAIVNPYAARSAVVTIALPTVPSAMSSPRRRKTVAGAGRTYSGLQPDQTTSCQSDSPITMAVAFGQTANQTRRARAPRVRRGRPGPVVLPSSGGFDVRSGDLVMV